MGRFRFGDLLREACLAADPPFQGRKKKGAEAPL
jgi:hypothetical protein